MKVNRLNRLIVLIILFLYVSSILTENIKSYKTSKKHHRAFAKNFKVMSKAKLKSNFKMKKSKYKQSHLQISNFLAENDFYTSGFISKRALKSLKLAEEAAKKSSLENDKKKKSEIINNKFHGSKLQVNKLHKHDRIYSNIHILCKNCNNCSKNEDPNEKPSNPNPVIPGGPGPQTPNPTPNPGEDSEDPPVTPGGPGPQPPNPTPNPGEDPEDPPVTPGGPGPQPPNPTPNPGEDTEDPPVTPGGPGPQPTKPTDPKKCSKCNCKCENDEHGETTGIIILRKKIEKLKKKRNTSSNKCKVYCLEENILKILRRMNNNEK